MNQDVNAPYHRENNWYDLSVNSDTKQENFLHLLKMFLMYFSSKWLETSHIMMVEAMGIFFP